MPPANFPFRLVAAILSRVRCRVSDREPINPPAQMMPCRGFPGAPRLSCRNIRGAEDTGDNLLGGLAAL